MEAADADFTKGLRYLQAARRCSAWCGDDITESRLQRLGMAYRARGMALIDLAGRAGEHHSPGRTERPEGARGGRYVDGG